MKILFLTPQLPYPPRQGTQIRNFHLLKAAASAHDVDLLSFARPSDKLDEGGPLPSLCGKVMLLPAPTRSLAHRLRHLLTSIDPDMAGRLSSRAFEATLQEALSENAYDLVQVEGVEMARYIPVVRRHAPAARVLFDEHNAEYLLQARAAAVDFRSPRSWPKAVYSAIQFMKLRAYEASICRDADCVIAVSEEDARALRRIAAIERLGVVPNGVDSTYYRPGEAEGDRAPDPVCPALLFTGTMDFRPNVDAVCWFASAVLPVIWREQPELKLYIVGRSPSSAVLELGALEPRITVTGPVDDVRPYFSRSTLFVAPIRMGGGVRLKLLEAMAMGLPVVSTGFGAEGIGLVPGRDALLADTPADFATAVLRLLDDALARDRLAKAGRELIEREYSWDRIAPRLLELYRGLT